LIAVLIPQKELTFASTMSLSPLRSLRDLLDGASPSSLAVTVWDNGKMVQSFTRRTLKAYILAAADELLMLGISPGDCVSIAMPNTVEYIIVFLAATWIKAIASPLNPAYKAEEYSFYMSDSKSKLLIVPSESEGGNPEAEAAASKLRISTARTPSLRHKSIDEIQSLFELSYVQGPWANGNKSLKPLTRTEPIPTDVGLYLHTSGTTSKPKLVPLSHHNLITSTGNIRNTYELSNNDICYLVMPLFHIHGLVGGLFSTLSSGGTVAIPVSGKFSAAVFWNDVRSSRATWYTAVPTIHQILLSRFEKQQDSLDGINLRFIRSCSASLAPAVMERLESSFCAPVLEAYAMTEASHQMTSNPLPTNGKHKPGSVGRPTNVQLRILDDNDHPVGPGEVGQICIRGENVSTGYINRPEANQEAFANGWFHTGDQGLIDEHGYLFLTGRLKEIINRGGEKLSPLEIDAALLEHPKVKQMSAELNF